MRIAYIGRLNKERDGGAMVSDRNVFALKQIAVDLFDLYLDHKDKKKKIKRLLLGQPSGWDKNVYKKIKAEHKKKPFSHIFIDHSMSGGFAKKLAALQVPISVFFHNIEYLYYQDKTKVDGAINRLLVRWAKQNEQLAVQYADNVICMTERDSQNLLKYYNRKADLIVPTTFEDKYTRKPQKVKQKDYHLFIGSNFFANVQGIRWYIENVLDHVNSTLVIIGKHMEFLQQEYPDKSIEVLGFVEDLEPYYLNADFVVNPVFLGSGMKTKTVEALMYGKTIFGTTEAFVGLEPVLMQQNMIQKADTPQDFIDKINSYTGGPWNQKARDSFLKYYDIQNTIDLYASFFADKNK